MKRAAGGRQGRSGRGRGRRRIGASSALLRLRGRPRGRPPSSVSECEGTQAPPRPSGTRRRRPWPRAALAPRGPPGAAEGVGRRRGVGVRAPCPPRRGREGGSGEGVGLAGGARAAPAGSITWHPLAPWACRAAEAPRARWPPGGAAGTPGLGAWAPCPPWRRRASGGGTARGAGGEGAGGQAVAARPSHLFGAGRRGLVLRVHPGEVSGVSVERFCVSAKNN